MDIELFLDMLEIEGRNIAGDAIDYLLPYLEEHEKEMEEFEKKQKVELDNQTNIYIKSAWLKFYLKDNKTMPYLNNNTFSALPQSHSTSNHVVILL